MSLSILQLESSVEESKIWCDEAISKLSEVQHLEFSRRMRHFRALKFQYLKVQEQSTLRGRERRGQYRFVILSGLIIVAGFAIFGKLDAQVALIAGLITCLLVSLEQSLWKIEEKQSCLVMFGIEKELGSIGISLSEMQKVLRRESKFSEYVDLSSSVEEEKRTAILENVLTNCQVIYLLIHDMKHLALRNAPSVLSLID